jgi:asparagine synthase (glutamine-hydrolysing)
MCGIAGTLGPYSINELKLEEVAESLKHRGPDGFDSTTILFPGGQFANLIFSRLSIIDLNNRAMQPMRFGHLTLLMNGEIYNYKELRDQIDERLGKQDWKTNGDTEVALRYISLNGIEGIKDFDGMFSIAVIDENSRVLSLARDFFGEKPLYYSSHNGLLAFSSEPKTIFKILNLSPELDVQRLSSVLVNGYKSIYKKENEFFTGINRVQAGHIVQFDYDNLSVSRNFRYKQVPLIRAKNYETRGNVLKKIKKVVIESVGRRLESDVPISICLSGGVDSGIIAAIAKKEFGVSLDAYTLASKDPRYSEHERASQIANFLGIRHSVVEVPTFGFLDRLKELIRYHDAPIATISYFIQSFLMEKIKKDGFKVSLMGTGADEIFSGYYDHHLLYLAELKPRSEELFGEAQQAWETKILPMVRNPIYREKDLYLEKPDYRDHIFDGTPLLKCLLKDDSIEEFQEHKYTSSLMRNRMLNELFNEVVPVILKEDDRNSMRYSVENRSPYLSYEILSEMMKVDTVELIKNGKSKSILREAFDEYLPMQIINNYQKIGFNAGFSELCDTNSIEFQEFINDNSFFWTIAKKDSVLEIFQSLGKADYLDKAAFNIVSTKAFVDIFTSEKLNT